MNREYGDGSKPAVFAAAFAFAPSVSCSFGVPQRGADGNAFTHGVTSPPSQAAPYEFSRTNVSVSLKTICWTRSRVNGCGPQVARMTRIRNSPLLTIAGRAPIEPGRATAAASRRSRTRALTDGRVAVRSRRYD